MTIAEKVKAAIETADKYKSLLLMLNAQLKLAVRDRKSGDTLPDDKATDIINKMIAAIRRDQLFAPKTKTVAEERIKLLQSFLQ